MDRDNEVQSKIEETTKSDLAKTQMKTMLANFLAQMKNEFIPITQKIPTVTSQKEQDHPNPQNKQKKISLIRITSENTTSRRLSTKNTFSS